jgi:hypothetical protein
VLLLVLDSVAFDREHKQEHDYDWEKKNEQKQRRRSLTTYELSI